MTNPLQLRLQLHLHQLKQLVPGKDTATLGEPLIVVESGAPKLLHGCTPRHGVTSAISTTPPLVRLGFAPLFGTPSATRLVPNEYFVTLVGSLPAFVAPGLSLDFRQGD